MRAALVTTFDQAPRCTEVAEPSPGPGEVVLDVLAAGLHPRVRSQADGSHYTSTDALPLVPGIDGVGRDAEGTLRYFVLPDTANGSMAERTVVDPRRTVALPAGADPVAVAAAMNPAMSSWIALRRRIGFEAGQRVLVLGATGNAGGVAVQVARHLGAGSIVAAGRDETRLAAVEADERVSLSGEPREVAERLGAAGADVDVVLDYVWGQVTADALRAIVPARRDDSQRLAWVEIGSVAGQEAPIPSAALRATRLELVGSGQGSVSTRDIVGELGELAAQIDRFDVPARVVSLEDVEAAWSAADRVVIQP